MIPRFGEPKLQGQKYVFRPGVYAVLTRGSSVLLTYQAAPFWEYQLPGGGVEPGESPLAALYREVYEETGWRITAPRRIGAFKRFAYMPEHDICAEKLCTIYHATPVRRIGPPGEDGHSAQWMDAASAYECLSNEGDRALFCRWMS